MYYVVSVRPAFVSPNGVSVLPVQLQYPVWRVKGIDEDLRSSCSRSSHAIILFAAQTARVSSAPAPTRTAEIRIRGCRHVVLRGRCRHPAVWGYHPSGPGHSVQIKTSLAGPQKLSPNCTSLAHRRHENDSRPELRAKVPHAIRPRLGKTWQGTIEYPTALTCCIYARLHLFSRSPNLTPRDEHRCRWLGAHSNRCGNLVQSMAPWRQVLLQTHVLNGRSF